VLQGQWLRRNKAFAEIEYRPVISHKAETANE
jgi:hypothetical protein